MMSGLCMATDTTSARPLPAFPLGLAAFLETVSSNDAQSRRSSGHPAETHPDDPDSPAAPTTL